MICLAPRRYIAISRRHPYRITLLQAIYRHRVSESRGGVDTMSEPRAWSFLTVEGARQYGGNAGYEDDPDGIYRYDSDVANHLQVSPGDIVFIRSKTVVLGLAEIEAIDEGTGHKERLRCPECRATNIKPRIHKLPPWGCKFGHQFEEPVRESVNVKTYAAHYGKSFVPCGDLDIARLHDAVLRPSDQMSIKEVDPGRLEAFLHENEQVARLLRNFAARLPVEKIGDPGEIASLIEARRRVLREIAVRRGQAKFRERLLRRYGARCQISGCRFTELVEAAHIRPYAACEDNGERNGLLLRSDLHTLFDLGYLGIEPPTLRISLHPGLREAGYADLDGQTLDVNGTSGPDFDALAERWIFFSSKLARV